MLTPAIIILSKHSIRIRIKTHRTRLSEPSALLSKHSIRIRIKTLDAGTTLFSLMH